KTEWNQCMHIYIVNHWEGDPVETEEMRPELFDIDKIPYDRMWEADQHWLPLVIAGHYVTGEFRYTENQELMNVNLQKQALR
ncbi:MAG: DNA mismatch repair protein MutT, partial [Nanoarchaeota archaeon]|nr:DNA mismatch repair protein MutT [Nanoarchaeota archaeon]